MEADLCKTSILPSSLPLKITTQFGEFEVSSDFKPLVPLRDCEEEVLEPLVDGLLYKNTYAVLSGAKSSYKSWLAGYIAACVALGVPCFGLPVTQGIVVYAYGEGNMKKRFKRICRALGHENTANLYPFPLRDDLGTPEGQENFKKHIPSGTVLTVIDNYEKFWGSDTDEIVVSEAMRFVRELREKGAVLLVQHDLKNPRKNATNFQKSKGHGRLMNPADSTLSLERHGDIVTCDIYVREMDVVEPLKFKLVDSPDDGIACEKVNEVTIQVFSKQERFNRILAILRDDLKEPESKTNIYERHLKGKGIKGLSSTSFYNEIFELLVSEGRLKETGKGTGLYLLSN